MRTKKIASTEHAKTANVAVKIPPEIRKAMVEFDVLAKKRYEQKFDTLVSDTNRRRAASRMRQLVGAAIKKDFSTGKRITKLGRMTDFKWIIDDKRLRQMPATSWQFQILQMAPERLKNETGKDVAARLRRETLLQKAYFAVIHPYLCQSPQVREEIKAILEECGLGDFAGLATPKGLLVVGTAKLYAYLIVAAPVLPAAAIAIVAVYLCVVGLKKLCRQAQSTR